MLVNNKIVMFKNNKKENEKHPDFQGNVVVNGLKYWISCWVQEIDDKNKVRHLYGQLTLDGESKADKGNSIVIYNTETKGVCKGNLCVFGEVFDFDLFFKKSDTVNYYEGRIEKRVFKKEADENAEELF